MPIVYDELLALDIPVREVSYGDRETMLYALSVGMGQDPMDLDELPFVFEKNLKALPSLSTVICWDDSWTPRTGINYVMVVHGEQRITIHKPLRDGAAAAPSGAAAICEKRPAGSPLPMCIAWVGALSGS